MDELVSHKAKPMHRIDEPKLKAKDSGLVLCYTEEVKTSPNVYDEPVHHYREHVYSDSDEEKAFEDFKKMKEFYRSDSNTRGEDPPEVGG